MTYESIDQMYIASQFDSNATPLTEFGPGVQLKSGLSGVQLKGSELRSKSVDLRYSLDLRNEDEVSFFRSFSTDALKKHKQ